tara:strand:+ start:5083 stop:5985 length:903 start_codon:yes stop_codon:yes gene_type:complete
MKVYLIGHKGWIGQKYVKEFKKQGIEFCYSDYRAESIDVKLDIMSKKATHVLCCMGRTHGTRDGKDFTTIDYLQDHSVLHENVNDNLYSPLSLAIFCQSSQIHFSYIGTGCIFTYDDVHGLENNMKFTEDDTPNFFGSNYSIVKGFTDMLMKQTTALNLRIRMPITDETHSRNFITKITNYEKICSISNSMTVLNDIIPLSVDMMKDNLIGTYNMCNPGTISHNEILTMYKEIVDGSFTWKNFTEDEQSEVLLSGRSNNGLCDKKLTSYKKIPDIHTSVRAILHLMKKNQEYENPLVTLD